MLGFQLLIWLFPAESLFPRARNTPKIATTPILRTGGGNSPGGFRTRRAFATVVNLRFGVRNPAGATHMPTQNLPQNTNSASVGLDCVLRRFKLLDGNQEGFLDFGKKRFPVRITEMSVSDFSAIMDRSHSQQVKVKSRAILTVLDREYVVEVREKDAFDGKRDKLELIEIDDFDPTDLVIAKTGRHSLTASLFGEDSLVHLVLVISAFVTILVVPSFGGKWGTADRISKAAASTWKLATGVLKR
jgi:hypothetical protein